MCRGTAQAELSSSKWNYIFPAILALTFVAAGFLVIFVFKGSDEFKQALPFVSTLVGSVTGYYFGARGVGTKAPSKVPSKAPTKDPDKGPGKPHLDDDSAKI